MRMPRGMQSTPARAVPPPPPPPRPPLYVESEVRERLERASRAELDAIERRVRIAQAFTPSAPVARFDLFAGRKRQLETLVDVIFEQGQHAIVYGERGVGKTSLARMVTALFGEDYTKAVVRINCDATDDFTSMWKKVVEELDVILPSSGRARDAIERAMVAPDLVPHDIRRMLREVATEREPVILLDEFDTVIHEDVTPLLADTIKTLSDQTIPATLIAIGVADNLDELLAEHGSINRSIVSVHMPRMATEELCDLVRRGLQHIDMEIAAETIDLIAEMSQGFPHFTHVLTQAAARVAADDGRSQIGIRDFEEGVRKAIYRIEAWIRDTYDLATSRGREAIYSQVLLGAALTPKDDKGFFAADDVRDPLSEIIKRRYNLPSFGRQLNALCDDRRGPVFIFCKSSRGRRYRFVDAHMEPYVLMRTFTAERTTGYVSL